MPFRVEIVIGALFECGNGKCKKCKQKNYQAKRSVQMINKDLSFKFYSRLKDEDADPYFDGKMLVVADGLGGSGASVHKAISTRYALSDEKRRRERLADILKCTLLEYDKYQHAWLIPYIDAWFSPLTDEEADTSAKWASRIVIARYILGIYDEKINCLEDEKERQKLVKYILEGLENAVKGFDFTAEKNAGQRLLPTTLASLLYRENKNDTVTVEAVWAGDSRCYIIDENGLRQLTEDDEDASELITNHFYVGGTEDPILHYKVYPNIKKPFILMGVSDGVFDPYSPHDNLGVEATILRELQATDSSEDLCKNLKNHYDEVGADDATMAFVAFGFKDYGDMKRRFKSRTLRATAMYDEYCRLRKKIEITEKIADNPEEITGYVKSRTYDKLDTVAAKLVDAFVAGEEGKKDDIALTPEIVKRLVDWITEKTKSRTEAAVTPPPVQPPVPTKGGHGSGYYGSSNGSGDKTGNPGGYDAGNFGGYNSGNSDRYREPYGNNGNRRTMANDTVKNAAEKAEKKRAEAERKEKIEDIKEMVSEYLLEHCDEVSDEVFKDNAATPGLEIVISQLRKFAQEFFEHRRDKKAYDEELLPLEKEKDELLDDLEYEIKHFSDIVQKHRNPNSKKDTQNKVEALESLKNKLSDWDLTKNEKYLSYLNKEGIYEYVKEIKELTKKYTKACDNQKVKRWLSLDKTSYQQEIKTFLEHAEEWIQHPHFIFKEKFLKGTNLREMAASLDKSSGSPASEQDKKNEPQEGNPWAVAGNAGNASPTNPRGANPASGNATQGNTVEIIFDINDWRERLSKARAIAKKDINRYKVIDFLHKELKNKPKYIEGIVKAFAEKYNETSVLDACYNASRLASFREHYEMKGGSGQEVEEFKKRLREFEWDYYKEIRR
ncbi:MAG: hypothetical protein LBT55_06235 [Clostridiaceae bacterium]|jgi:serine/threonine protein phosphatase PrpC|nr:hypothetical protein [Clostridiaceae bacterium]